MSTENTLYPNLRQIAANVRAAAGTAPCQVCGAEAARPYVFAYGKKLHEERSSSTQGSTTTTTTTTYYGSLSARAVHLCASCVGKHRSAMATRLGLTIALLAVLSVALIVAVVAMPGDQVVLTIFATILPLAALFFGAKLHQTLKKEDLAGLDKAVRLHRKGLEQEGYDSFWRDPENPGSL